VPKSRGRDQFSKRKFSLPAISSTRSAHPQKRIRDARRVVSTVCQETHYCARNSRLGHSEGFSPRHHPKLGRTLTGFGTQEWRIAVLFRINSVSCPPLYLSNPESLQSELVAHPLSPSSPSSYCALSTFPTLLPSTSHRCTSAAALYTPRAIQRASKASSLFTPFSLPDFPELPCSFPVPDRSTRSARPPTTVPRRLRRPLAPYTSPPPPAALDATLRLWTLVGVSLKRPASGLRWSTLTSHIYRLRASSSLAINPHTPYTLFFLPVTSAALQLPHTHIHPIRPHTDRPTTSMRRSSLPVSPQPTQTSLKHNREYMAT
jgi:hypothetical protein